MFISGKIKIPGKIRNISLRENTYRLKRNLDCGFE
jgi:hypothetical protein